MRNTLLKPESLIAHHILSICTSYCLIRKAVKYSAVFNAAEFLFILIEKTVSNSAIFDAAELLFILIRKAAKNSAARLCPRYFVKVKIPNRFFWPEMFISGVFLMF